MTHFNKHFNPFYRQQKLLQNKSEIEQTISPKPNELPKSIAYSNVKNQYPTQNKPHQGNFLATSLFTVPRPLHEGHFLW